MTYEQLWAPWRMSYIAASKSPADDGGCFLCRAGEKPGSEQADGEDHVVLRTPLSIAVLNRYPYNNGHLLISPRAHKGRLDELDDAEMLDGVKLLQKFTRVYERTLRPDGFNIGLNLGRAAGAGLPGHLHWHLVPRWNGDTNFMSVVDDSRVISQSLQALDEMLRAELSAMQ